MIFFLICSQATFLIWQFVMGSKWSYGAKSRWKLSSVMRFTDGCRKTLLCVPVAFLQVRLIGSELVSGAGKWLVEIYWDIWWKEKVFDWINQIQVYMVSYNVLLHDVNSFVKKIAFMPLHKKSLCTSNTM